MLRGNAWIIIKTCNNSHKKTENNFALPLGRPFLLPHQAQTPTLKISPSSTRRNNNLPSEGNWLLASEIRMTQERVTKNIIRLKYNCLNHEQPERKSLE